MDLSIIVPAYNEQVGIQGTLQAAEAVLKVRPWTWEVLVVDDGSQDRTADAVAAWTADHPQVRLLRNPGNRGKGYSVRHGMGQAAGHAVGFIDADNKTDLLGLDLAMERLAADADLVIGDRTLPASDIAVRRRPYRQWGSDQFRRLLRWWMGLGDFPDTQCGFKFLRAPVAADLFGRQQVDGYMFDVELLLLAVRSGYRVERIPVRWRDDPDSRFRPVRGSLRNLGELARIRRLCR
ncbi:MAG: dolichyl-phosphate beta-glucosyltransferase [Gemmatimonadota bacterium]